MEVLVWLAAALFLPLFPLSMLFNGLLAGLPAPWRGPFMLVWPLPGLAALGQLPGEAPDWLLAWALATALLYALRTLTLRELHLWAAHLATSVWALFWLHAGAAGESAGLVWSALGFGVPLLLLSRLAIAIEQRLGAAYAGIHGGLATPLPRLSRSLVLVLLALVATPLFPGFAAMLAAVLASLPGAPLLALGLLLVWLLWTWAAALLIQGLLIGPPPAAGVTDLGDGASWAYGLALVAMLGLGVHLIGALA